MFFDKYQSKKDGVIRGYDIRSGKVKVLAGVIMIICMIMVVICLFPAVWVFLASFKDIKEFTRNVTIIPEKFDWSRMEETWNAFKFTKYYMNSMISVLGCTICAGVFNGRPAYGLSVLKPKGYQIINGLVMWSLLIPGTVSIVAVFRNINLVGLNKSFVPLWLAFGANAFYVVLFKQFFEEIQK